MREQKGREISNSIRNWIIREYERILNKALLYNDELPECEPTRNGKRRRKEATRA